MKQRDTLKETPSTGVSTHRQVLQTHFDDKTQASNRRQTVMTTLKRSEKFNASG